MCPGLLRCVVCLHLVYSNETPCGQTDSIRGCVYTCGMTASQNLAAVARAAKRAAAKAESKGAPAHSEKPPAAGADQTAPPSVAPGVSNGPTLQDLLDMIKQLEQRINELKTGVQQAPK